MYDNWPAMKQIFRSVLRKKIKLLDKSRDNRKSYVIIYGACSHMGKITSNLFIKYNYSLIMIDADLQKL
jgi:hypothetical protein